MAEALSPVYPKRDNPAFQRDCDQLQTEWSEPVVLVQPPAYIRHEPPAKPVPDYRCYSIFTSLWCLCLGAVALHYSRAVSIH